MSEALRPYDHIHAGAFLAPRTLPIETSTVHPNSAYAPAHGVRTHYGFRILDTGREIVEPEFLGGVFVITAPRTVRPNFMKRVEKICGDLERLQDGWCGDESLAPSVRTLSDLYQLLVAIPTDAQVPDVEVDEETGHVALRWTKPEQGAGFSFVLRGDGRALAVKTEFGAVTRVTSKPFSVAKEQDAIARYLASDDAILGALTAT